MRKNLIIIMLVMFATTMFAQTIETVDVSKAPSGAYRTNTSDGTMEGTVVNGHKDGTWIEYFASPAYLPKRIINYKNGKRDGVYLELDKTGSITKKAEYKNDKLNGQCSEWFRGGRLSKLNTYKDDVLEGQQILCYEKGGNLEVSNYKNGKRDGLTTWYYEKGTKKMTIEYKEGRFEGKQQTFYEDGSLKSEANFKNGKQVGKTITYNQKTPVVDKAKVAEKEKADKEKADFVAMVGKGTYIRTLAHDIAHALNTVGVVVRLHRIKDGPFDIEQAVGLDDGLIAHILPMENVLGHLPKLNVDENTALRIRHGQRIKDVAFAHLKGTYAVMCADKIVALAEIKRGILHPQSVF